MKQELSAKYLEEKCSTFFFCDACQIIFCQITFDLIICENLYGIRGAPKKLQRDNVPGTEQQTVRPAQAGLEQPNYSTVYHCHR